MKTIKKIVETISCYDGDKFTNFEERKYFFIDDVQVNQNEYNKSIMETGFWKNAVQDGKSVGKYDYFVPRI